MQRTLGCWPSEQKAAHWIHPKRVGLWQAVWESSRSQYLRKGKQWSRICCTSCLQGYVFFPERMLRQKTGCTANRSPKRERRGGGQEDWRRTISEAGSQDSSSRVTSAIKLHFNLEKGNIAEVALTHPSHSHFLLGLVPGQKAQGIGWRRHLIGTSSNPSSLSLQPSCPSAGAMQPWGKKRNVIMR